MNEPHDDDPIDEPRDDAPPPLSLAEQIAVLAGHAVGDLYEAERAAVGAGAGEALAAALPDADDRGRGRLLRVIARVGGPAEAVTPMLHLPFPALRLDAARALGACGRDAAAPLTAALADATGTLRAEIIRALGRAGHPASVDALAPLAAQGESRVAAIDALGQLGQLGGEAARACLVEQLAADDAAVRAAAARALSRTGPDARVTAALLQVFARPGEPHDVRRNAMHALASVAVPLPDADPTGPAAIVAALGGPFGREAKAALARLTQGAEAPRVG